MDGAPCRQANRKFLAWLAAETGKTASPNTAAYCKARVRLPLEKLNQVHGEVVRRVEAAASGKHLWQGRRVKVVDGSSVSMSDTRANQQAYPQPQSQKPGCGFPVMRITALFCLGTGVLLRTAQDQLEVHERTLFRRLWESLQEDDVILADRGFCGFADFAELLRRGIDSVMRKHQCLKKGLSPCRKLGKNDWLVHWRRTAIRPNWLTEEQWASMPVEITVREITVNVEVPGFRTKNIVVLTTLLDHKAYPASAFAQLYRRRWAVELYLRDIKITLGMDVLSCLTPGMVLKELTMHLILYNVIRAFMLDAAAYGPTPQRISFKGALDTIKEWTSAISMATGHQRTTLLKLMCRVIAADPLHKRPDRTEPRARKRRPKNYPLLTSPRRIYKEIPHRNRYTKVKS